MSDYITAVEVVRDSDGYWIHPDLPDFDEDAGAYNEWLKVQSLETSFVWLESERDDHPAFISYFENADLNISTWEPTPPDGDGWFLICISDTDDGPAACYARRIDLPVVTQRTQPDTISAAARDVLAERQRQVSIEGWTPEHDDAHADYKLSSAAGCYAMFTLAYPAGDPPSFWPWDKSWWKPSAAQRRNLIKAGALILAEIERLDRAASRDGSTSE